MLYIHGIGHYHPDNVVDNAFLESLGIDTTNEWILERVGIRERRTVLSLDYIKKTYNEHPVESNQHSISNAVTGAHAARAAMAHAKLKPKQIGLVIAGSCTPQYSLPADACAIAAELGIMTPVFDLNSACSTFAAQMHILKNMLPEALPDYVLVVIPDNTTRAVNYRDRRTAVLWGDGTVALVVSKKIKSHMCITHTMIDSNPAGWNKVIVISGGHFTQEGQAVQRFAIKTTVGTLEKMRELSGLKPHEHYFIGHQANLMMLRSVCEKAAVPENRHLYNVEKFGNCGGAGAPIVLSQNWSRFVPNDKIIMVVVGAGLSWGGLVIEKH